MKNPLIIKELLEEKEYSYYELHKLSNYSIGYIRKLVNDFNLKHRIIKVNSYGCEELYTLCTILYPTLTIIREHCIGNRLRVDIFIKELNVALEFDGQQHKEFNKHFHQYDEKFMYSKQRDNKKEISCNKLGIHLLRFTEVPTKDYLYNLIEKASQKTQFVIKKKEKKIIDKSYKNEEWYINQRKDLNKKASQYRKKQREYLKELKNEQNRII